MDKEIERIAEALTKGESIADFVPKSKSEAYLKSALMKQKIDDLPTPASRLDVLLCLLNDNVHKLYDAKFDDGYSEGYDTGLAVNYDVGYSEGYAAGNTAGNATGHEAGVKDGYISGHADGYTEGFTSGRETGNEEGHEEGYSEGIEAGKQANLTALWEAIQNGGKRTDYNNYPFRYFTDVIFAPIYDIAPTSAQYEFASCYVTNLKKILDERGVKLDTSKMPNLYYFALASKITHFGIISAENAYVVQHVFRNCSNLVYVEKLICAEKNTSYAYSFTGATKLTAITFEGVIPVSIDLSPCPLTVESAKSAICCLKNYAGTDKELTYTFKLNGDTWTALEASGAAPDGGTWKSYVYSLGWNT